MDQEIILKKEEIRIFLLQVLSDKGKDTNYVNKRMQDSLVNFFLEDYVAPLLCNGISERQSFHKKILKQVKVDKCNQKSPKYCLLLSLYVQEIEKLNLTNQYKKMLMSTILKEETFNKENCLTLLWRKQLCILLLEHLNNQNLNSIYLMWNAAYPSTPIYNKKESFYRRNIKTKKQSKQQQKPLNSETFKKSNKNDIINSRMQHSLDISSSMSDEENDSNYSYPDYLKRTQSHLSSSTNINQAKIHQSQSETLSKCSYTQLVSSLESNSEQQSKECRYSEINNSSSISFVIIQSLSNKITSMTYLSHQIVQL